jgi:hypothetical protein
MDAWTTASEASFAAVTAPAARFAAEMLPFEDNPLEPVRRFDASDPLLTQLCAYVEQHSQIGLKVGVNPPLQRGEFLFLHAASAALIGETRIRKTIAKHTIPAHQCWPDYLFNMLAPGREHQ